MSDLTFELHLDDQRQPSGQIRLAALAGLAGALQELETRIARDVDARAGAGRTPALLDELSQLRLIDMREGSVRLFVRRGDDATLDYDLPLVEEIDRRFVEIIEAIGRGERPGWMSPLIAESTGHLVAALRSAAPRAVFAFGTGRRVALRTADLRQEVWRIDAPLVEASPVTAVGVLEAVDLRTDRFRLRDDVGSRIALSRVLNAEEVATFVGRRVQATGTAIEDKVGHLTLDRAVLEPFEPPREWLGKKPVDLDEVFALVPGPDPDGGIEMTDEEFEEFLRLVHG
jgi:hypothetical protein